MQDLGAMAAEFGGLGHYFIRPQHWRAQLLSMNWINQLVILNSSP
jgi:hypothetical protein